MSGVPATVAVRRIDLSDVDQARAFLDLLDHYARDPMGGGAGLRDDVRASLVESLQEQAGYHGALAWQGGQAIGLINCFSGFSTFAARPLLNIHDIVVRREERGRGTGRRLLEWAEATARQLGCCKLTLEVLSGNASALATYRRAGFRPYVLDPSAGQALFLEKRF
jgi:GNAT superfamily N-acetyltransferase